MTKITLRTFKSFVENNKDLYIKTKSSFDGMNDCITPSENKEFKKLISNDWSKDNGKNTLGFLGIWLVGNGRDYFIKYEDNDFIGIECSNCCGSFIISTKKEKKMNFTQFCEKNGYVCDYDILEHSLLSPNGKRSKRGKIEAMKRMQERCDSNRIAHLEYNNYLKK